MDSIGSTLLPIRSKANLRNASFTPMCGSRVQIVSDRKWINDWLGPVAIARPTAELYSQNQRRQPVSVNEITTANTAELALASTASNKCSIFRITTHLTKNLSASGAAPKRCGIAQND